MAIKKNFTVSETVDEGYKRNQHLEFARKYRCLHMLSEYQPEA